MTLSRREFEQVRERVTKLENMVRALEDKIKLQENRSKGDSLLRAIRDAEEHERIRKEREAREREGQI